MAPAEGTLATRSNIRAQRLQAGDHWVSMARGSPSALRDRWNDNTKELDGRCVDRNDSTLVHKIARLATNTSRARVVLLAWWLPKRVPLL